MAYQQTVTPRFYINIPEWLHTTGRVPLPAIDDPLYEPTGLAVSLLTLPIQMALRYHIPLELYGMTEYGFVAILGHEFATHGNHYRIMEGAVHHEISAVVNSTSGAVSTQVPFNGYSISTFTGSNSIDEFYISGGGAENVWYNFGSVVIGSYYTLPVSSDMKMTLEYDYSGIKTIETRAGVSLSNANWTKPTKWGDLGAWELSGGSPPNQTLSRTGRRIWSLNFSFLDDGHIFGANQALNQGTLINEIADCVSAGITYDEGDVVTDVGFNDNILTDDSFYSQVIHKTNGGQLPFIFQPDVNDNTNFAIAELDMKSYKFKQVANGIYSVKLKIREVW